MRGIAGNLLVLVGSIGVGLLLAEGALRLAPTGSRVHADAAPRQPAPPSILPLIERDEDPDIQYRLRADAVVSFLGTEVRTNSLGFRGPELRRNTYRIVGIGDSVMFGQGVEEPQTYLRLVESRLRRTQPDVEIVNTAILGYNTVQEVALLERHLDRLEPRLVIVGFLANDLWHPRQFLSDRTYLDRHSYLYRLVTLRGRHLFRTQLRRRQAERSMGALQELATLARRHRFRVVVFFYAGQVDASSRRDDLPFPEVRPLCRQLGFDVIDYHTMLVDAIQRGEIRDSRDLWRARDRVVDPHPGPAGHALMARNLAPFLRDLIAREAIR